MSSTLCLSITFLTGQFHGQNDYGHEWPPSPYRLYQALLAAAARNGCDGDDAFHWLEQLSPPEILAQDARIMQERTIYVPNNDSDVKLDRQARLVPKQLRPQTIPQNSSVHYLWPLALSDESPAAKIASHARLLTALGWGIDLVAGDGRVLSGVELEKLRQQYDGICWKPTYGAPIFLRCPRQGTLDDLRKVYESSLNRFKDHVYTPAQKPRAFQEIGYAPSGLPLRQVSRFRLIAPGDDLERMAFFDQRSAIYVAAWVRGLACACARQTEFLFPSDSELYVAGHAGKEEKTLQRFSYLPLPTIGHCHSDGSIRRFVIAEPYGGAGNCAKWANENLHLKVLTDEEGTEQALLQAAFRDGVFNCYERYSRSFKSVTPVILPGYDDLKYAKAEKLFKKAVVQAGYSLDEVEDLNFQKAPFFSGAFHPRDYVRPKYLKNLSAMHVYLKWKKPISGPVTIGSGRHIGLGLFAAAD